MVAIFILCFAPSLALLGYFYLRDEYDREPLHLVLTVFGGGLLAGPIAIVGFEAISLVPFYDGLETIDQMPDYKKFVYAIMAIGVIEEVSKFLVFWYFIDRKHVLLNEPADGMVYAAAVALGFATIENWYFMFAAQEAVWSRAITLPFNHVLFSSFWGVAVGVARFEGKEGRPARRLVTIGLVLAIVFHGLYDYILFTDSVSSLWVAPLVLVLWLWVSLSLRDLLRRSPYRPNDPGEPEREATRAPEGE